MGRIIFQTTLPGKSHFSIIEMVKNIFYWAKAQGYIKEKTLVIDKLYVDFKNQKLTNKKIPADNNGDITFSVSTKN